MTGTMLLMGAGHSAPTPFGGGGGGSFDAADYGTLLAWYDYTDTTKVLDNALASVGNSGSVDRVVDNSTNAYDARQTTSGNRPSVITAALNGLQVLNFDGTDDFLRLPSSRALIKNKAGVTICSIHTQDAHASAMDVFNLTNSAGAQKIRLRHLGGDGQWAARFVAQDGGADNEFYSGGGNLPSDGTWYINIYVIDFSGNTFKCWQNGTQVITSSDIGSSGNCGNTDADTDPVLYVGDEYGARPFDGKAAMTIIWDGAMNDTNRNNFETDVGALLGITVA